MKRLSKSSERRVDCLLTVELVYHVIRNTCLTPAEPDSKYFRAAVTLDRNIRKHAAHMDLKRCERGMTHFFSLSGRFVRIQIESQYENINSVIIISYSSEAHSVEELLLLHQSHRILLQTPSITPELHQRRQLLPDQNADRRI